MELPKRKKIRLTEYDYSLNGAYFITVCTKDRLNLFGEIVDGIMNLNEFGKIVDLHMGRLNSIYDEINVETYVIMPNHIHIIILICRERIVCVPKYDPAKAQLPKMVQSFKSSVTKEIRNCQRNAYNAFPTTTWQKSIWQKSFHDRIIRNEREYIKIWQYIDTNPMKWEEDCFYAP